jgi:hypothetical protein
MQKIRKFSLGLTLMLTLLMSSCHFTTNTYTPVDRVQAFIDLLNSQYAYDSQFYMVKHPDQTATQGFVVVYSDDTGYMAYDISSFQVGDSWNTYSNYAEYQEVYVHDWYTDSWGEVFYIGDTYYNNYWGDYAGEYVFETSIDKFKDLEKMGALKEAFKVSELGKKLSSEYGLSEERGIKIAKMTSEWNKVGKRRELTASDADSFSKELIGINLNDALEAFKKSSTGDQDAMSNLVDAAANANGTSPEHMNALISDLLLK